VDVTLNRKGEALVLNLVNTTGPHDNEKVMALDEITPVGPLQIELKLTKKPNKVMLQPDNIPMPYTYREGKLQCSLPMLKIHSLVVIE
jgi:hypothetical protein